MSMVKQFEFAGQFSLTGTSGHPVFEGLGDLNISFDGRANLSSLDSFSYLINLLVYGMSGNGSTQIGAEVRSFSDYNYFKITDIVMPLGLPFSLTTDNQWYKIRRSENGNADVLGANPRLITAAELEQIRALISHSRLFLADQRMPDETVNGVRSYHLRVIVDRFALDDFLDQLNQVTHGKLKLDKSVWMRIVDGYSYHLWITKRDYQLTKLEVQDAYVDESDQEIAFSVKLNLTQFDVPVNITRPSEVMEFSLPRLFGLPLGSL